MAPSSYHLYVVRVVCVWTCTLKTGAGNDWQKDRQFRKLNAQRQAVQVKVVRNGQQVLIDVTEVAVGDLLMLDTGDKVRTRETTYLCVRVCM